jgi:CubicO group peptidase (beta-lactamase class C family)
MPCWLATAQPMAPASAGPMHRLQGDEGPVTIRANAKETIVKCVAAVLVWLFLGCAGASAQEWPTATPESQGMESQVLAATIGFGAEMMMDSLVVARNGRIVAEAYYAPYRASMKHRVNSATKGVVGTLTGIAIARHEMPGTMTPLAKVLPAVAALGDPRWNAVTVQSLLDMTSGLDWNEPLAGVPQTLLAMQRSPNWQQFILARRVVREPGTVFDYNSGNAHLLSIALARRTGMPTDAYARKVLFEPLGIRDTRWVKDPQGVPAGAFGLYLHTRDMARLGQLYLQQGAWNGRQVVPREWVERVFAPKVDMDLPGGYRYADFWWSLPARRTYMMMGFNRQLVMVMPDLNIVVAATGRSNYSLDDLINLVQRAAVSSTPLPENAEMQARLRAHADSVADGLALLKGEPVKPAVMQGSYRLDDNPGAVREFSFDFAAATPSYRIVSGNRELVAPIGLAGRFVEGDDTGRELFTRGTWTDPNTLLVEQRWPEEGAWIHYLLRFSGNEVDIESANGFGMTAVLRGRRAAE